MTHTPLDCEKRGTTTAKQIAECSYDNDHREAQTDCAESSAADARNPCDIDTVRKTKRKDGIHNRTFFRKIK